MRDIVFLCDKRMNTKTGFIEALSNISETTNILLVEQGYEQFYSLPEGLFSAVFEVEDITRIDQVEEVFERILDEYDVERVIAPTENVVETGGYLRSRFGIPGIQKNQAETVRNKWIMKETLRQAGIHTSQTRIASNAVQIRKIVAGIGFPIIIKPISGWATIMTYRLNNQEELEQYISHSWNRESVLIEEFITGREFHIDSIVSEGELVFSSVSEYLFNCLEIVQNDRPSGTICYPANTHYEYVERMQSFNEEIIRTLGIRNSVFHAEVFLLPNGEICFGEIGARIGGIVIIPPMVLNSHQVNLFDAAIQTELGIYEAPTLVNTGKYTGAVNFPSAVGKIESISSAEDFKSMEGLIDIRINFTSGQSISGGRDTMSRSGFAIVEGPDIEFVRKQLLELHDKFVLVHQ
ncbi:ATP-grasp domain-containing protein [Paenibacillus sp. 1781tsa1]|uniref:ATP-grasp domain-containing protein n=1 Tax=Paenibacillus sp. 1781tsa1 TaxID=2953810 RepID=UPI00209D9751|nr:ATP-grasp domain-containing protein [Paenibacillus sp. 1781tsa1]MCP1181951.1 ATP-grasp domain-containing protein [Paenibacillus sp. 1781tsa1]